MPELPDLEAYRRALVRQIGDRRLHALRIANPFLLRSVEVRADELDGRKISGIERIGKRLVLCFDQELFAAVHLMIAGRFRWRDRDRALPRRRGLAAFDFEHGSLWLTEEGTKKRASLHLVRGRDALRGHDPGGQEVPDCSAAEFLAVLRRKNHTLKRALTDPRLFSGIGNAYSDEILHRARLSPVRWTDRCSDEELARLHRATLDVLSEWTERLCRETRDSFPEKVTAFREGMAVHGRFGQPCPDCSTPVQRIRYTDHETNYCPRCQTGGKLLADRSLSRLLKGDWPKTIEELESGRS